MFIYMIGDHELLICLHDSLIVVLCPLWATVWALYILVVNFILDLVVYMETTIGTIVRDSHFPSNKPRSNKRNLIHLIILRVISTGDALDLIRF